MSTTTAPHPQAGGPAPRPPDRGAQSAVNLGEYAAPDTGLTRRIVGVPRPDGSTLVVDCLDDGLRDGRLVAHLRADEPPENARIVTEMYLADETRGRCRPVSPDDFETTRGSNSAPPGTCAAASLPVPLRDPDGYVYRIREVDYGRSMPELRWIRSRALRKEDPLDVVTLREVVAALEDYEPARTVTAEAIAVHRDAGCTSVSTLHEELKRLDGSRVVLNRRLREAVQSRVARGEATMTEIAMRCGRIKRDKRGRVSGETSWLARRIGRLPEGGEDAPTPWIHSDVLALIVRVGLGASPHEVEL
jgi:hypothetical protein